MPASSQLASRLSAVESSPCPRSPTFSSDSRRLAKLSVIAKWPSWNARARRSASTQSGGRSMNRNRIGIRSWSRECITCPRRARSSARSTARYAKEKPRQLRGRQSKNGDGNLISYVSIKRCMLGCVCGKTDSSVSMRTLPAWPRGPHSGSISSSAFLTASPRTRMTFSLRVILRFHWRNLSRARQPS